MELKPGYKQTEVGVIPEDWDVSPLNGKVTITHGFAFSSRHFSTHGPFRLTTPGHFFERGGFREIGEKQKYFTGEAPTDYILRSGDLIVAMTEQSDGLLGSAAFIPDADNYLHNQRLGRVRTLSPELDPGYLYYIFNSTGYRTKVRETAAGTKVKHTSPRKLLEILVQMAPIAEQQAIAQTLKDLEAMLDTLEDLIVKKNNIKQAAMQELLTGKRRLPGFEGEWEVKRLDEIADVIDPHPSHRAPDETSSGIPFLGIGDLDERGNVIGRKLRLVDTAVLKEHAARYSFDDELIGLGRVASIGKVVCLKQLPGGCAISPTLGIIRGRIANRNYIMFALRSSFVTEQFTQIMSGSTRSSIGMEVLRKLNIKLPPTTLEQDAIAEMLNEMDVELASLEGRLGKTLALKQGMMQQLLTGKIRLI